MSVRSSDLLARAPTGRHFAQLYSDPTSLAESVGVFIEAGLRRDDPVIVISQEASAERFLQHVRRRGLDPGAATHSGQLVLLDADRLLADLTREGTFDWVRFRETVCDLLRRVQAPGRGITRLYGEMVNLLWHRGRTSDAIQLEETWNALAGDFPFCVFCGYHLDGLDPHAYAAPWHEIGRTHSDVLRTAEDDRLRRAVDTAVQDLLGVPLSATINLSGREAHRGEHRLPLGCRTMLWLTREMPGSCDAVVDLARRSFTPSGGLL